MINLTICSPQLGLSPSSTLGGEIYDVNILKRLDRLGFKLKIILPYGTRYPKLKNAEIKFLPIRKIPAHVYNIFWLPFMQKILREGQVDLFRAHSSYYVAPSQLILKKIQANEIKIVSTQHHLEPDIYGELIHRKILPKIDGIIAVANDVKKKLVARGVDSEKIQVIFNGIDQKRFFPKRKSKELLNLHGITDKDTTFLFLGQLIRRKRIDIIIKAFKKLSIKNNNIKLIIAGTGNELNSLKELVNKFNLNQMIKFSGYVDQNLVNDYYNLCDVFIFHSILDALPFAVLEAMACKKPIIASNVGDVKFELSDKENGFLIKPEDEENLLKYMEFYHKNKEKIEEHGKKSLDRIKKYFTWDVCVNNTIAFYKKLI